MNNQQDMVNHPPHYANGTKNFECIDIMEHIFGEDVTALYCLQNAFKYIWRMGSKGKNKEQEDLGKAKWYLDRYIKDADTVVRGKWDSIYFMLLEKVNSKEK